MQSEAHVPLADSHSHPACSGGSPPTARAGGSSRAGPRPRHDLTEKEPVTGEARASVREGDTTLSSVPRPSASGGRKGRRTPGPLALQSFAEADGAGGLWHSRGGPGRGRVSPSWWLKCGRCHTSARFGALTGGGFGVLRATEFVAIRAGCCSRPRPGACGRQMAITGLESGCPRSGCRPCRVLGRVLPGSRWPCSGYVPTWQEARFLVTPLRASPVTGAPPHDLS